jgi:hypothetical protein
MIGKTAKQLLQAGYTVEDVKNFDTWWYSNDFRGRAGDPPTLPQVIEKIKQSKSDPHPAAIRRPGEKTAAQKRLNY